MRQHVILVEDESDIVELLRYNFSKEGFDISAFTTGGAALSFLRNNAADLVLLDIMLPDQNGIDVYRSLRNEARLANLPVIFVTARGAEVDRILGLELGADDYVVKPFSPRELVARARAVLRRQGRAGDPPGLITIRELCINALTQEVSVRGGAVVLSALEFKLLHFLACHPRQVFSRETLLDRIWGRDRAVIPRTIDVHIRRIREKIEQWPSRPEYIHTVRGAGYRFAPDASR